MLLTEWNEEKFLEDVKKESEKRGEEIGQKRGEEEAFEKSVQILETLRQGKDCGEIAKELEISEEIVQKFINAK